MIIFLLLMSIPRVPELSTDTVDRIELNHVYGNDGLHLLDQLVFWDLVDHPECFAPQWKVVDFCTLKGLREQLSPDEYHRKNVQFQRVWDREHPRATTVPRYTPRWLGGSPVPRKDYKTGKYVTVVRDQRTRQLRRVVATSYSETWTQIDTENENKRTWPVESRRRLKWQLQKSREWKLLLTSKENPVR